MKYYFYWNTFTDVATGQDPPLCKGMVSPVQCWMLTFNHLSVNFGFIVELPTFSRGGVWNPPPPIL